MRAVLPVNMQFNFFEVFAFAVGLCFGSFANVVICRLSCGKSIIAPSSYCPVCDTPLKRRDMIPIISWLLLRCKCRHCKEAISKQYPLIEGASAVLFLLMARHTGATFFVLPLWGLAFVLLCVSVIDWYTMKIPDSLLIFGAIAGLSKIILYPYGQGWQDALLGIAAGAMPLLILDRLVWIFAKKPGFGYGDVKLMSVAGLFLGWYEIFAAYFVAFVAGGIYAAMLLITGKAKRGGYLAFAPFLAMGILVGLLS